MESTRHATSGLVDVRDRAISRFPTAPVYLLEIRTRLRYFVSLFIMSLELFYYRFRRINLITSIPSSDACGKRHEIEIK